MVLYYGLLLRVAVFSVKVSAFVLVCGWMLTQLGFYPLALFSVTLVGSCAMSVVRHHAADLMGILVGAPRARAHLDAITVPVTQQMALEAETELTVTTVQMVMTQQGAKMNADDISEGLPHLLSNCTCP